jgi:hypothetical protein
VIPKHGKSNYTLAKSYQPISSLSWLGKIIEKIIASRIANLGKICRAISSIQFGNKEDHCVNDALLRTLMNITAYLRPRTAWDNSALMRPLLEAHDAQGAFNNTQPEILIKLMMLHRMLKYLVEWIKDFTLNRTLSFSFDNQIESPKPFCNAIPHGSSISPIFFPIMMSALMEGDHPKHLPTGTAYVDDLNDVIAARKITTATLMLSDSFHYKLQHVKILGLTFAEDKPELIHFPLASHRKLADGQSMVMPDQLLFSEIQPSE